MINKKMPTAIAGSISYVILTILFLTLGAFTQKLNIYFGIFFTEAIILGLFTVLVCKYKNYDLKESLGLNFPLRGTLWKAFFIALISYPLMVSINAIYLSILQKFMNLPSDTGVPLPNSFGSLIISIIMFAALPGIFEELVFRGFLFRAFDRFKPTGKIIITAILFGIFHYNPINIVGPLLMGLTFGYMRHRSNSLLPSMIAHTTNNSIAMIIGYFAKKSANTNLNSNTEAEIAQIEAMLGDAKYMVIIFGLIFLLLFAFGFYRLMKKFPDYSERVTYVFKPGKNEKLATILMFVFGAIIFSTVFILFKKMF